MALLPLLRGKQRSSYAGVARRSSLASAPAQRRVVVDDVLAENLSTYDGGARAGERSVGRAGWGWHAFRKVGRTRIKVRNGVVNRASPAAVVVRNDQRGAQTVIYRPGKEEFSPPCPGRTFSFAADKRTTHSSPWTYIPQSSP